MNQKYSSIKGVSKRRLHILRLLRDGLSQSEVAERLGIASSSVRTHVSIVCRALGVKNYVGAITRAIDLGLLEPVEQNEDVFVPKLEPRELRLLEMLQEGKTTREMASALGCVPKTIRNLMLPIFQKLGVHTRATAVTRAIKLGVLEPLPSVGKRPKPVVRQPVLSEKDVVVLTQVREGKSYKEIAAEQGVQPKTIRNRMYHLYQMFGVHDCHAAVEKAIELGLLKSPGLPKKVGSGDGAG